QAWAERAWSGRIACRGNPLPQAARFGAGLAKLTLDLAQLLDPLVKRRVGGEERRQAHATATATAAAAQLHRRSEVEGVKRFGGPQVLRRDPVHPLADLGQRGDQRA